MRRGSLASNAVGGASRYMRRELCVKCGGGISRYVGRRSRGVMGHRRVASIELSPGFQPRDCVARRNVGSRVATFGEARLHRFAQILLVELLIELLEGVCFGGGHC